MIEKCALILITGDRTDFIDYSIKCCENIIKKFNNNIEIDIFLISFNDNVVSNYNIKFIKFEKPDINSDFILNFPRSNQQLNSDIETIKRVSFGHSILFGLVPDKIFENKEIFSKYDYILKSRSDLIFDIEDKYLEEFNQLDEILTFECFWGGCRYNNQYTNDHFVFGKSEDVLKLISFPIQDCILDRFWNPEQYMTFLYNNVKKKKIEMSTNKYYLLSSDRKSRKFIGYPMEKINEEDSIFIKNMGIDFDKLKLTDTYDF